jgi:hypothetical protein
MQGEQIEEVTGRLRASSDQYVVLSKAQYFVAKHPSAGNCFHAVR